MASLLKIGSIGEPVKQLQGSLNFLPTVLPRLKIDGIFGPRTQGRVFEFQRGNNLSPDGVVGENTLGMLEELRPDDARRVYYDRTDSPLWKIIEAAADVVDPR